MSDPFPPEPVAGLDDLSDDLRGRVKSELAPDERLLWAGRGGLHTPDHGKGCLLSSVGLFAAGVLTAIVAGRVAGRSAVDNPAQNLGAAVAVVGAAGIVLACWAWLARRAGRRRPNHGMIYALTDRRAIFWLPSGRRAVEVHTVPRGAIERVYRIEFPDGSGDVLWSARFGGLGPIGFKGIADVRRVEELARRILLRYDTPSPD